MLHVERKTVLKPDQAEFVLSEGISVSNNYLIIHTICVIKYHWFLKTFIGLYLDLK